MNVFKTEADRYAITPVSTLPRLNDPNVPEVLLTLSSFLQLPIGLQKVCVAWVVSASGEMEGEGYCLFNGFIGMAVVAGEEVEECLLIANVVVMGEVVMHL